MNHPSRRQVYTCGVQAVTSENARASGFGGNGYDAARLDGLLFRYSRRRGSISGIAARPAGPGPVRHGGWLSQEIPCSRTTAISSRGSRSNEHRAQRVGLNTGHGRFSKLRLSGGPGRSQQTSRRVDRDHCRASGRKARRERGATKLDGIAKRGHQCARLIVPVNVALDVSVGRLIDRSTTKVPEAPSNRPVPPVIVWVSSTVRVGKVTTPCPVSAVKI
jgi:hypothetical protein